MKPQDSKRFRPSVEALEDRLMPANYLMLDFTPDTGRGTFASAFNLRYTNGRSPSFLDMNGDRRITMTDVKLAAWHINARVGQILSGFNINVGHNDVTTSTNFGTKWLRWGVSQRQHQVFVIHVGGWSGQDTANNFTTGMAPQAPLGYNNETYGSAFATSIVRSLMPGGNSITSQRFINEVAATVVHEFGHLVGLGHVIGNPRGDINVMNYSTEADYAAVPNAVYRVKLFDARTGAAYIAYQNPGYELALSLAGQPGYAKYGINSYKESHDHRHHDVQWRWKEHGLVQNGQPRSPSARWPGGHGFQFGFHSAGD